jgi:DNA gyrase/topoisomerase IV subunit B
MTKRKPKLDINEVLADLVENWTPADDKRILDKTRGSLGGFTKRGRTHSEESKQSISKALKNKVRTQKHSENISKAKKGHTHSEGTKKKIGLAGRNRVVGEQTREKLRVSSSGRKHSKEDLEKMMLSNPNRKAVCANGVRYSSMNELARALGVTLSTIQYRVKSQAEKWKQYFFIDKEK